jgi:hypothetical protein
MNTDRLNYLADEVRVLVFQMLDSEPEVDGEEAGRVAAAVEDTFRQKMTGYDVPEYPDAGWEEELIERRTCEDDWNDY